MDKTRLLDALHRAGHYLPAQAPLEVFVHHNTLHAFQHLPFHDALAQASRKLGARCYLSEESYRTAFREGRISESDVRAAFALHPAAIADSAPTVWSPLLPPSAELRLRLQIYGLRETGPGGLRWLLFESDATRQFRVDLPNELREKFLIGWRGRKPLFGAVSESEVVQELWHACVALTQDQSLITTPSAAPLRFPRELLLAVGDEDPNELVHPVLIPLCAAFLDRGQAHFAMPLRGEGFYSAWRHIAIAGRALRPAWEKRLGERIRKRTDASAEDAVLALLDEIGIADFELDDFVEYVLLQLPSWAGMFQRLEGSTLQLGLTLESPKVRLIDFLAVRLSLDVLAYQDVAERVGYHGPLRDLCPYLRAAPKLVEPRDDTALSSAWKLFNLAQLGGIETDVLRSLSADELRALLALSQKMNEPTRLRIWHDAFEHHYRQELLGALWRNAQRPTEKSAPRFIAITCIDDRMESFRRHLEEQYPDVATYGAAGFFNLAIAFQGIDDPSTFPLCPVVVKPRHRIAEEPDEEDASLFERRKRRRRSYHQLQVRFDVASRSLILGSLLTAFAGFVATVPLLLNVFLPKFAARMRRFVTRKLLPEVRTRLSQSGHAGLRASATAEIYVGFSLDEKVARVGGLLENLGLKSDFADVVVVLGHDSTSVNNPHFAAYSCGACGGRSGGPNARLFASMANDPDVRELLKEQGIQIPPATLFVGGVHDTCADSITLYDEAVPEDRKLECAELQARLNDALMRHAHERTRRFASASPDFSIDEALEHVEERASDLSQARPELGHATNASCIVGRRALSRDVFLDRRAFLVSYDPTIDKGGEILERILLAVGPVCAGINLEYFFSTVDNERLGAGTKLPHNVTGLIAVMNGAASDLRTGLPKQMVEVHEPVRLQLVLDARPEVVLAILERQPALAELIKNEWLQAITISPDTHDVHVYQSYQGFVHWLPPSEVATVDVASSAAWYYGKRSFVPPAIINKDKDADAAGKRGGGL